MVIQDLGFIVRQTKVLTLAPQLASTMSLPLKSSSARWE